MQIELTPRRGLFFYVLSAIIKIQSVFFLTAKNKMLDGQIIALRSVDRYISSGERRRILQVECFASDLILARNMIH